MCLGSKSYSYRELLLAATYIEDARSGWKLSLHFDPSPRNLSYYLAFRSAWGKYLLYLVLAVHMALALFEEPALRTLQVNYLYPACVELFCVAFYVYRCLHLLSFTSHGWFWKDVKNLAVISVILLTIIDIVVYMGMKETGAVGGVRWSRPLRPLLMINIPESRQIRRAWRSVSRTLPDVAGTMVLFVLNLLLFALMAYKLFGSRGLEYANGRPYFSTYQDSVFDLYVLVTTANSPDVMMPALNASPPMFLFFVVFVLISLYLFMNVILAVIYNSYRKHLKKDVQTAVAARRLLMSRAFSLLGRGGAVLRDDYVRVMAVLRPEHGTQLVDILWRVLDPHGDGMLGERDLYQLADLLNVRVTEVKDRVTLLERLFPSCFNSRPAVLVRRVVRQSPPGLGGAAGAIGGRRTAPAGMWSHARLLRRAVLVVSLLTLTSLHVQQERPAAGWRAARLLPLSLGLAFCAAGLALTLTADSLFSLLYNVGMSGVFLYCLCVLVYLLGHRRRLHVLLDRVAELDEATARCRRRGDYRFVQWQCLLLVSIQVLAAGIWGAVFFIKGEFEHPHYLVPVFVPPLLRGPAGYWLVVTLQVLSNNWLFALSVLFDLILVGLTDASTLLLMRLSRLSHLWLAGDGAREHTEAPETPTPEADSLPEDWVSRSPCLVVAGDKSLRGAAAVRISVLPDTGAVTARRRRDDPRCHCAVGPAGLDPCRLRELRQLYGRVSELTAAGAALCSLPTLGLHALVTGTLLIGLYVNVQLFRGGGDLARAVGYALFLLLAAVRLLLVSVSGSRLADRSQQLHAALAGARWSGHASPEARLTLQLLLAQTQQPLGFDGWGLFVTHKTTMQSLLGFVLTYFIIMVQMSAPASTDVTVPFRLFFDLLIVVNAITIAVDADQAEWAFLAAFILEILLKMYAFGFREFFDKLWNMFDFVVIGGAFLISVVRASTGLQGNTLVLDVLLLFRCLRVVKLMDSVAIFRAVLRTIASFSRSIVTYGGVLFCVFYFFALLGMELFADRVMWAPFRPGRPTDCGDRLLKDTDFSRLQYCANNFNSLPAALAVLFELMVVNQWHVLAEGYAAVTTQWARLYFVAFHLCCVVLLLNIFTAFILEAFILEFTTERTTTETRVERKIAELGLGLGSRAPERASGGAPSDSAGGDYTTLVESDELDADHDPRPAGAAASAGGQLTASTGVRFHIDRGPRSVEVLLQRMFESGETDLIPESSNGRAAEQTRRPFSLCRRPGEPPGADSAL
ncbi:Two pore calcium channel protein 1 [Amphibalanus amphitrite]|uniref:Two pore calcium channel protein 1 n=1 Tax=Amphibalanus amphitrite TaxID=1232801 RepID=A0A6A4WVW9_AMPAM|nr:Two pore calcium channel protein 1 [Amphibalanus amphitrite]